MTPSDGEMVALSRLAATAERDSEKIRRDPGVVHASLEERNRGFLASARPPVCYAAVQARRAWTRPNAPRDAGQRPGRPAAVWPIVDGTPAGAMLRYAS